MESTMEERKWEELKKDCLVQIFARVGTQSLLESIPFVCKSWYDATLDPDCWKTLTFPNRNISSEFVKFVVDRSKKSATSVVFHSSFPELGLFYISDECPELRVLGLPDEFVCENSGLISVIIGKWKNLELFVKHKGLNYSVDLMMFTDTPALKVPQYFEKILESISIHCMNFTGLEWYGSNFEDEDVSAIVKFLPKIKLLILESCSLSKDHIVMILKGCTELEHLDVSNCIGFEADDEILELSSQIKSFNCTGSKYDDIFETIDQICAQIIPLFDQIGNKIGTSEE